MGQRPHCWGPGQPGQREGLCPGQEGGLCRGHQLAGLWSLHPPRETGAKQDALCFDIGGGAGRGARSSPGSWGAEAAPTPRPPPAQAAPGRLQVPQPSSSGFQSFLGAEAATLDARGPGVGVGGRCDPGRARGSQRGFVLAPSPMHTHTPSLYFPNPGSRLLRFPSPKASLSPKEVLLGVRPHAFLLKWQFRRLRLPPQVSPRPCPTRVLAG